MTGKPVLAEGWRLNLSAFPLKRAPHAEWNNEIEKTESFLLFPSLEVKVRLTEVKSLFTLFSLREKTPVKAPLIRD